MDSHANILRFLQEGAYHFPPAPDDGYVIKAGLLPFMRAGQELRYFLMLPQAKRPDLGAPPFQLGKGTRMMKRGEVWVDMRHGNEAGELEPLEVTALREGMEELGVRLNNIARLLALGRHAFVSASTGHSKSLQLFAAQIISPDDFAPDSALAETTAQRRWMTLAEFADCGRADTLPILQAAEAWLRVIE